MFLWFDVFVPLRFDKLSYVVRWSVLFSIEGRGACTICVHWYVSSEWHWDSSSTIRNWIIIPRRWLPSVRLITSPARWTISALRALTLNGNVAVIWCFHICLLYPVSGGLVKGEGVDKVMHR